MYGTVRCGYGMTVSAKIMMWDYMEGRRRVEGEKLCATLVFFAACIPTVLKYHRFLLQVPSNVKSLQPCSVPGRYTKMVWLHECRAGLRGCLMALLST